jgi:hypothetical protein
LALRLQLSQPVLGQMLVELDWAPSGMHLTVRVELPESVPYVRERMKRIAAVFARANLRIARFSVVHDLSTNAVTPLQTHAGAFAAESSDSPLFRAAAEVVVALLQHPHDRKRAIRATR